MLLALQERRVNVVLLEMQEKLRLKDEKLKQLRAIVESETVPEYPPHQMQPFGEGLPEQTLISSTPLPVCHVDRTQVENVSDFCIFSEKHFCPITLDVV